MGDTETEQRTAVTASDQSFVTASTRAFSHAPHFLPILKPIREKVEAGERLSLDDGLVLERPDVPLPELGELANLVRERKNGNAPTTTSTRTSTRRTSASIAARSARSAPTCATRRAT